MSIDLKLESERARRAQLEGLPYSDYGDLSGEQVAQLHRAINETLSRSPDALYLYKHDPIYHAFVKAVESAKRSRQPLSLHGLADLVRQVCEAAYRLNKRAVEKFGDL